MLMTKDMQPVTAILCPESTVARRGWQHPRDQGAGAAGGFQTGGPGIRVREFRKWVTVKESFWGELSAGLHPWVLAGISHRPPHLLLKETWKGHWSMDLGSGKQGRFPWEMVPKDGSSPTAEHEQGSSSERSTWAPPLPVWGSDSFSSSF